MKKRGKQIILLFREGGGRGRKKGTISSINAKLISEKTPFNLLSQGSQTPIHPVELFSSVQNALNFSYSARFTLKWLSMDRRGLDKYLFTP